MSGIIGRALTIIDENVGYHAEDTLIRRLRANYDKLSIEQIQAIMQTMGHRLGEEKPCPVCKIIAQKEYARSEAI